MDSIDLIKSKSIRGFSTPLFLKLKKDDGAINTAEVFFFLSKKQEKQLLSWWATVAAQTIGACWKTHKRRKDRMNRMTSLEYTHDSPGHLLGPQDSKLVLIRLTMSICYPAGNLTISQCSSANTVGSVFQPGPAELVTNDVQIMLRGSILLNQNQIRPRDDDQHFNHSAYGIERTSSAGNNTNYIGKRKEIRIPLRWWWLSTGVGGPVDVKI